MRHSVLHPRPPTHRMRGPPPTQPHPAGIMLERAGATAVVPEILEPSLQLAAAVLSQVGRPARLGSCSC